MNLQLSETQTLLRDTVREFLEKEVPFSRVREAERALKTDAELWRALCGHGWLGVPFPSSVGGGDGSLVDAGIVVEEIERRAAVVPSAEVLTATLAIHRYGSGARASDAARAMLAGELVPVPAVAEASDRFGDVALEVGSDGRLRGEKWFVDYADVATHHLVVARSRGEIGLHLVDARDRALALEPLASIGRTPQFLARYDGVAAERLCGAEGWQFLARVGQTLSAVRVLACMQQALDMTVKYTSVREQFGRPIGSFQAVHHHAANMAMLLESTRFLVYEALDSLDRGSASDERIAIAKASAARAVPEVTMLAHQLHGGHGYIEENDLYFFTIRGRQHALAWGSAEECLARVAETIEAREEWL